MRRTKIVCTIGPSSSDEATLAEMIRAGMDVARLNFSHGEHETHRRNCRMVREVAARVGRNVAVLIDLQGPKIRTGRLKCGEPLMLEDGGFLTITTRDVRGEPGLLSTTYEHLPHDVSRGDRIMLADGLVELRVEAVEGQDVRCTVVHGGPIGEFKGINLPNVVVSAPTMTEKDIDDLAFGLELGVDFVALSFVRSPDDVAQLKERIRATGKDVSVLAKIERPEAVERFEEILEQTDLVMVARGDLGVEMELDRIPQIQKSLIKQCNGSGVPAITATQMLESMMDNPRPTRAEVTDVANAIYDGTDAVMLSGETAVGRFPVGAVRTMAAISERTDQAIAMMPPERRPPFEFTGPAEGRFSQAIGQAVSGMARFLDVRRIVCFTMSGYSARAIARFRPRVPVTAITMSDETKRRCAPVWGVEALKSEEVADTDDMVRAVDRILLERELCQRGDTVLIVAGTPLAVAGGTNFLRLHCVGDEP